MSETRPNNRYSLAFKQKVVSEIESGKFTLSQVRRIYDINGAQTLYKWLRKLGKGHLIEKIVRIEMKDEKDKLKELQQKNQQLESALAQTQLKLLMAEAMIESVEAHYKIDVKKTFGLTASNAHTSKSRKKG
jgi:transposase-like protein